MEIGSGNADYQSDGNTSSQRNKHLPGENVEPQDDKLPEEIVLKADYSCYCTVCECTLSRIKDAIQHASGKRHKKACNAKSGAENNSTKRQASGEGYDGAKKLKTELSKEEEEAKKMLAKVFDETFHGGVVALRDNYYCKVCRCMIGNNRKNVNQHKEGKSHKMALEKFKESLLSGTIGDDIPVEDPNQPFEGDGYIEKTKNAKKKMTYYCRLCDFRTKEREVITEHMNEEKHQENVYIQKEKEFAQQGSYHGFRNDYYGEGAEREMYPEEYYGEMGMERFGPWNACGDDIYYDREQPPHYGRPFDGEPYSNTQEPPFNSGWNQPFQNRLQPQFQNRQDLLFHGGYQNDMWNCHSENFMPNPENHRDHLMMPQMRSDPLDLSVPESQPAPGPLVSHIQNDPMLYMSQPQQTPVPFIPQPHPAAFPQSQQIPFPNTSELRQTPDSAMQQRQATNTASGGLPGFITGENDAEVVIDVISSLLQTYLKYRLQALPGSFMKLLRKSSKNEENVSRINKLSTGETAKQIFINVQNHKSKIQSTPTPDDERLSQPVLYERRSANINKSSKTAVNEQLPYRENVRSQPMDDKTYNLYNLPKTKEIRDSYDQRSYIEDQLKKAVAAKSLIGKQSENSSSRKGKEIESSIDALLKQCRNSSNLGKALENTMQAKPSVADFSKRYTSSSNDDTFSRNVRQNEGTTNDLFVRYRRSNREDNSPQNIRRSEPSSIDFSNRYRSSGMEDISRCVHQNTESVLDLFKRYRSSSAHSHT